MIPETQKFWNDLPGGATVAVNIPLPGPLHRKETRELFSGEQKRTLEALDCLLGGRLEVTVMVPARRLAEMPVGVFCVERVVMRDDGDGIEQHRVGHPAFLHPSGKLAPFYTPRI